MSFLDRFKKKEEAKKREARVKEKAPRPTTLKPKAEAQAPALKQKTVSRPSGKTKDNTKNAYRVLVAPIVTEKATDLVSKNKYAFEVTKESNKVEIKKAIKNVYGFEPVSVRIVNVRGKDVSYGRMSGKRKSWKKAIVTLKKGDKIEIYEGV
ncbi:MAG: 50S ribosomal protein L23 [Patescibacteria group bacterium]|nr:50S ribosomal protein L23 [Patescibacteria group bacterium]